MIIRGIEVTFRSSIFPGMDWSFLLRITKAVEVSVLRLPLQGLSIYLSLTSHVAGC